jgi:hypothetical protein
LFRFVIVLAPAAVATGAAATSVQALLVLLLVDNKKVEEH